MVLDLGAGMSDWRTEKVIDLQRAGILLVEDGNHGEYRPRPDEFVDQGVAFIRAANINDGQVLFNSASKISKIARERITKGIGSPGDVLLSHKGTVGKLALVPEDAPPFVCSPQTTFWRTLNSDVLDRRYLYSFMRSPLFRAQLGTRASETDMAPYVSLTSQRALTVVIPPIGYQRTIAHILGNLDDKIELNRRMNETLEAMAQAIFKSWFVDFDPVRAKMNGKLPESICRRLGLTLELLDLFHDRFQDSELGEIPEGRRVGALEDMVILQRGFDLPKLQRTDGAYPLIAASGQDGTHNEAKVPGPGVVTGRSGKLGIVTFVQEDFWPLNTTLWIKEYKNSNPYHSYMLLSMLGFERFNSGSAVPTLNRNHVHGMRLVVPPNVVVFEFSKLS
jgi:type I restriction enzyme S subunit